jgi:hypothetical protein
MARERKGLLGRLVDVGFKLAGETAGRVMSDRRGQEVVARAVGLAQRSRERLDDLQARAMRFAGIPGKHDYQELAKQLARLKRKTRELSEQLEGRGGEVPGAEAEEVSDARTEEEIAAAEAERELEDREAMEPEPGGDGDGRSR